jgi:hypothetical protein
MTLLILRPFLAWIDDTPRTMRRGEVIALRSWDDQIAGWCTRALLRGDYVKILNPKPETPREIVRRYVGR